MKSKICFVVCASLLLAAPFCLGLHDTLDGGAKGIASSSPAGIGGNGPFPSENMDLLGRLPLDEIGGGPSNVLGNDCWGWTHAASGREFALCGLSNATSFVEVTDPTNPIYLGKLPTTTGNSTWRDMKVYADHMYVVSDGNGAHGMQVFDLTQLLTADPNNPQNFNVTTLYDDVTSAHNIAINEDTGYAYIVGATQNSGGLHIVDLSTPASPTFAAAFEDDGYTHDAQIVTYTGPDTDYSGQEIAFASNEDTLTIVDVTNKNNLIQISRNGYPDDFYTHQNWLSEDQRYVYLCDELDERNIGGPTRTHIWDCLDLDNPVYLGFHPGSSVAVDHNLYIRGNKIFLASYAAGLRVLEIGSGPTDLTEVASFDTYVTDNDADFDGAWSCYPYFPSGNVLVNDRQNGMFIVRLSPIVFDLPNGLPELIDPNGGTSFEVNVSGFDGTPAPGTGMLHLDRGNGFELFPMTETSANNYVAEFPTTECGEVVSYFVSAESTNGDRITYPAAAPGIAFSVLSADGVENTFEDDFESNQGWTVSGDATDGIWERGIPDGAGTRGDPSQDADGSGQCFVTGNGAGNTDIDNGTTIVTSPLMDAIDDGTGIAAFINYNIWYSNDVGNAPASDILIVEMTNDDGDSWVAIETIGPSGSDVSGGWFSKKIRISDFLEPSSEMRMRVIASDLGDASVVEAGLDGVRLEIVKCDPQVTPDSFSVLRGSLTAGDLAEISASDDQRLELRRATGLNRMDPVTVLVEGTLPTDSPSSFKFQVESSVSNFGIFQSVLLFNFDTNEFELIERARDGLTDNLFTLELTSDFEKYIEAGTGNVRARLGWRNNPLAVIRGAWDVEIDHVFWE